MNILRFCNCSLPAPASRILVVLPGFWGRGVQSRRLRMMGCPIAFNYLSRKHIAALTVRLVAGHMWC
jgi:hypothetical protein